MIKIVEKEKVLVVGHRDGDGRAASAVVALKYYLEERITGDDIKDRVTVTKFIDSLESIVDNEKEDDIENLHLEGETFSIDFILLNHNGEKVSDFTNEKYDTLYIVDYSFDPIELTSLADRFETVHIYDHHDNSFDKFKDFKFPKNVKHDMRPSKDKLCGAEITFMNLMPNKSIPSYIELIGEYDTWRGSHIPEIEAFNYATRTYTIIQHLLFVLYTTTIISNLTDYPCMMVSATHLPLRTISTSKGPLLVSEYKLRSIIQKHLPIVEYNRSERNEKLKRYSFEAVIDTFNCLVLNGTDYTSKAFLEKIDDYDFCIMYTRMPDKRYKYGVYTTKYHAGNLAAKFGGGGHDGAAGFTINEDIFKNYPK